MQPYHGTFISVTGAESPGSCTPRVSTSTHGNGRPYSDSAYGFPEGRTAISTRSSAKANRRRSVLTWLSFQVPRADAMLKPLEQDTKRTDVENPVRSFSGLVPVVPHHPYRLFYRDVIQGRRFDHDRRDENRIDSDRGDRFRHTSRTMNPLGGQRFLRVPKYVPSSRSESGSPASRCDSMYRRSGLSPNTPASQGAKRTKRKQKQALRNRKAITPSLLPLKS